MTIVKPGNETCFLLDQSKNHKITFLCTNVFVFVMKKKQFINSITAKVFQTSFYT